MTDPYWRIFAEEVPADLGIQMTKEQIDALEKALVGAHENYGLASGRDVADQNWRAAEDSRLRILGEKRVLDFIQERCATLDGGSSKMFDVMTRDQRLALHEIFKAADFLRVKP